MTGYGFETVYTMAVPAAITRFLQLTSTLTALQQRRPYQDAGAVHKGRAEGAASGIWSIRWIPEDLFIYFQVTKGYRYQNP